jgi:hypothetical protein
MRPMAGATPRRRYRVPARIAAWIGRHQQDLSDRVHASADDRARRHGWEITKSTGRFGFGARLYHDPRFRRSAPALSPVRSAEPAPSSAPGSGAPGTRPGQKPTAEHASAPCRTEPSR